MSQEETHIKPDVLRLRNSCGGAWQHDPRSLRHNLKWYEKTIRKCTKSDSHPSLSLSLSRMQLESYPIWRLHDYLRRYSLDGELAGLRIGALRRGGHARVRPWKRVWKLESSCDYFYQLHFILIQQRCFMFLRNMQWEGSGTASLQTCSSFT